MRQLNVRKRDKTVQSGIEEGVEPMKRIGLVVKADDNARKRADELIKMLEARGVGVVRMDGPIPGRKPPRQETAPTDLASVFVLGGDGTFLSAVRWIGDRPIPVLGVKFGEVGFLAETTGEDLFAAAEQVLSGEFDTESRMRLRVTVKKNGETVSRETVLNDVVINKGALARLAHIETFVDSQYLTTYRADGLIVATPTGSTAYSLAAGGPIVHPHVSAIELTPISPFTLTNRPLIVPDTATITLRLSDDVSDIMLTFDGQSGFELDKTHEIIVEKSPHSVNMIRIPGQSYYDLLKAKLRWSGSRV